MKTLINSIFITFLTFAHQPVFANQQYSVLYTHMLSQNDPSNPTAIGDLSPQHSRPILSDDGNSLYGHTGTKIYKLDFGLSKQASWATLYDFAKTEKSDSFVYGNIEISKDKSRLYGITKPVLFRNNSAKIFALDLNDTSDYKLIHEFPAYGKISPVSFVLSHDGKYMYGLASTSEGICSFPEPCKKGNYKNPSVLFQINLTNMNHPEFNVMHVFNYWYDGEHPNSKLVMSKDGNTIYGSTKSGGAFGSGTVFKVDISEKDSVKFDVLYNFQGYGEAGSDLGGYPDDLVLAKDEMNLYGTVTNDYQSAGYVFQLPLSGDKPKLRVFDYFRNANNEGRMKPGELVLSSDGSQLFGKTTRSIYGSGQHSVTDNGLIFKITLNQENPYMTRLYSPEDDQISFVMNPSGNAIYWNYFEDYYAGQDRKFSISELSF